MLHVLCPLIASAASTHKSIPFFMLKIEIMKDYQMDIPISVDEDETNMVNIRNTAMSDLQNYFYNENYDDCQVWAEDDKKFILYTPHFKKKNNPFEYDIRKATDEDDGEEWWEVHFSWLENPVY